MKMILHYTARTVDYGMWYSQVTNFKSTSFTGIHWVNYLKIEKALQKAFST